MKKKLFIVLICVLSLFLVTGCSSRKDEPQYEIYELAKEAGFEGTYDEWLATIKGENGKDGKDGKEIELKVVEGKIAWRYVGDEEWKTLVSIEEITGPQGEKGEPGAKGDKGDQGEKGEAGAKGDKGDQGEKGEAGKDGVDGKPGEKGEAGKDGVDGKPGEKGEAGKDGVDGKPGEKGEKVNKVKLENLHMKFIKLHILNILNLKKNG